jgi:hypothetical protein
MSFFPTDYRAATAAPDANNTERKSRYFDTKRIKDGESVTFRLCGTHASGHVIAGWAYYTAEGKPRRFPKFPENYLEDIGLTYEGRTKGTGEKDKPSYFLSFCALVKETDDFMVFTINQKKLREQLETVLAMEDYKEPLPSGMFNFYATIKRSGEQLNTNWMLTPTLKAPTKADEKRWADASASIWLPALYLGADPFAGKPATARPEGLPPTHRDAMGADHEVATAVDPEVMPAAGW